MQFFFSLELKTVLSLVETSNVESDVKQRAWMLRSLITHVNTESVINIIIIFFKLPFGMC
jgi:hypothetical protein